MGQPGVIWIIDLNEEMDHPTHQISYEQLDGPEESWHRLVATTPGNEFLTSWGLQVNRIDPTAGWVTAVTVKPTGVARFALSPDGKFAIAGLGDCGNGLRLWSLGRTSAKLKWETPEVKGTAWPVFGFFPDWKRVAIAGRETLDERGFKIGGNLAVHRLNDGAQLQLRAMPITGPEQVLVTPDQSRILVLTTASFFVFDATDVGMKPIRVGNPKRAKIEAWAMHPSGRHLVTVGKDTLARVWDTSNWNEATAYQWDVGPLTGVAFSPDGTLCAVAGKRAKVVIWDWDV